MDQARAKSASVLASRSASRVALVRRSRKEGAGCSVEVSADMKADACSGDVDAGAGTSVAAGAGLKAL